MFKSDSGDRNSREGNVYLLQKVQTDWQYFQLNC